MSNPRLLLLDEVSLGLAPVVVKQVYAAMPTIRAQGTTLLIVEQDVNQALAVADRFYCLLEGRISLTGAAAIRRPDRKSPRPTSASRRSPTIGTVTDHGLGQLPSSRAMLLGGLYALLATGLSLGFGVMRLVNLAHGDMAILAAFMAMSTASHARHQPAARPVHRVARWRSSSVCLLQRLVFDRLVGGDPAFQIVATFGLSIIIQNALAEEVHGGQPRPQARQARRTSSIKINDDDLASAGCHCDVPVRCGRAGRVWRCS